MKSRVDLEGAIVGTLCRIWWSAVAIGVFLAAAPAVGQDDPAPRMAIEQAMREAAIRLQYLNLTPSWPDCGEESAPMYPPDGYYGAVIEKNAAANLVGSLASAILTLVQEGNFLREEYVQAVETLR